MGVQFSKKGATVKTSPTVADAIASNQAFSTSFGTVYHKAKSGEFVKFGNPQNSSRNFVTVKPSNYFNNRLSESVTLLGDLQVSL